MHKHYLFRGVIAAVVMFGAGCGATDEESVAVEPAEDGAEETTDAVEQEPAESAAYAEAVTPEVTSFACGRNENLSRVVASGQVDNPFTNIGESTLYLEIEVLNGAGERVETVILEEPLPFYEADDTGLPDNWEAISSVEVAEEDGPFECEVAVASITTN
jgi:hypothetical protein